MPTGLGDEQLWISPTNDGTGSSTAFNDQSGNGNSGTGIGGVLVVSDTSLSGSYAFDFDGSNDYIRIYDGGLDGGGGFADFLNSTDNWSFSVYAKTDGSLSGGGAKQIIAGGRLRARMAGVSFGINTGYSTDYDLAWKLLESGSTISSTNWNNNPSVDSDWHHVCYVNDGGTVYLYIDGVASAVSRTKTSDANGIVTSLNLGVGGKQSLGSYFNGRMDDIRIYDRTITTAEITHLASSRGVQGSPGTTNSQYNAFATHAFKQLFETRLR